MGSHAAGLSGREYSIYDNRHILPWTLAFCPRSKTRLLHRYATHRMFVARKFRVKSFCTSGPTQLCTECITPPATPGRIRTRTNNLRNVLAETWYRKKHYFSLLEMGLKRSLNSTRSCKKPSQRPPLCHPVPTSRDRDPGRAES
jgi:hypothetical protein